MGVISETVLIIHPCSKHNSLVISRLHYILIYWGYHLWKTQQNGSSRKKPSPLGTAGTDTKILCWLLMFFPEDFSAIRLSGCRKIHQHDSRLFAFHLSLGETKHSKQHNGLRKAQYMCTVWFNSVFPLILSIQSVSHILLPFLFSTEFLLRSLFLFLLMLGSLSIIRCPCPLSVALFSGWVSVFGSSALTAWPADLLTCFYPIVILSYSSHSLPDYQKQV